MTHLRGEMFVFIVIAPPAALASGAAESPRAETLADLLPSYVVSQEAREAREAAETRLTSPPEGGDHDPSPSPSPSPDCTWLAFASTRDSGVPQLYRRAMDGGTVRRLTSGPGARLQPAVDPGGARIACAGEVAGSWDILVLPSTGGRETNFTSTPDLDEIDAGSDEMLRAFALERGLVGTRKNLVEASILIRDPARFFPFAARLVASRAPVRATRPGPAGALAERS